ncbi:hypothetical protein BN946_scf184601.g21 [Trametes cinnabarina]|uniref:Velvet domain-containing protein n=1 Tax=Pycnoporus cinnabarinus TaxID=5643 RepID=A0A060SCF0_PYCCI|nr:hypothetical protein BN946_scf184601.g21 [Trametes cinnabarina]
MAHSIPSTSITTSPGPGHSTHRPVPVENTSTIGLPQTFATGVLTSRTIRIELEEIQKPDHGHKRPLDPPPVVLCRFFELVNGLGGTQVEVELDPDYPSMGMICHLELFPVPPQSDPFQVTTPLQEQQSMQQSVGPQAPSESTSSTLTVDNNVEMQRNEGLQPTPIPFSETAFSSLQSATTPNYRTTPAVTSSASSPPPPGTSPSAFYADYAPALHEGNIPSGPTASAQMQTDEHSAVPDGENHQQDIVATFGDFLILESSNCSNMLSGTTSVPAELIDYKGKKSAVFVFSDVAVKAEGTFVLRYRAFNVLSKCANAPLVPALAECYGGPCKVYSSKEFPGLQASTELTKSLAMHGVRVNVREVPRRRRKYSESLDADSGRDGDDRLLGPSQSLPDGNHHRPGMLIDPRMSSRSTATPGSAAGASRSPTSFTSQSPPASLEGSPFLPISGPFPGLPSSSESIPRSRSGASGSRPGTGKKTRA